jgi:hypothetical protein
MPSVKSAKQTLIHDDTKEGEVAVHYNFFFLSFGRNSRHFRRGGTHGRLLAVCADVFSTSFFSPAEYEGGNVGEVK